ncbi:MAG: DUF177 domain-containing protein [Deltaproteobacteria bacterium]|nr:DUF177 domain-containing protein [Deltaproteobacteria bacterium]
MEKKAKGRKPYEIDIYSIPEGGLDLEYGERDKWLIDFLGEKGLKRESPFHVTLFLERVGPVVFVKGSIHAALLLTCARCGEDFSSDLAHPFSAGFSTDFKEGKGGMRGGIREEVKLAEGETGLSQLDTHFLNIVDLVGEQFLLETPMQPLCNEACKGRCSRCGESLNSGKCQCGAEKKENPFYVLKKLKGE